MSRITKAADVTDARRVALDRATKGKRGGFVFLHEDMRAMEIGDMLTLTDDELLAYKQEIAHAVTNMTDGSTFTKAQEQNFRNMLGALVRQIRKSTNNDKADLVSEYLFVEQHDDKGNVLVESVTVTDDDGVESVVEQPVLIPAYAVRRTA